MSKKRDRHLIASEAHEQKHKEMREFRNEYAGWTNSTSGFTRKRGWIGKTRFEFENNTGWHIFVFVPIALFLIAVLLKACS